MARNSVFLDTNGLIALLNRSDVLWSQATDVWNQFLTARRPFVVTDWVLAETGNGMARTSGRVKTANFLAGLASSAHCEVVFIAEGLLDAALARYRDRADKTYGLIDCCSMIVMESRDMSDAFTTDHHFEQEGFNCLLRSTG